MELYLYLLNRSFYYNHLVQIYNSDTCLSSAGMYFSNKRESVTNSTDQVNDHVQYLELDS